MYAIVQHTGNPDASADTCADTAGYSLNDWGHINSSCDDNCGGTYYCSADSCSDDNFGRF